MTCATMWIERVVSGSSSGRQAGRDSRVLPVLFSLYPPSDGAALFLIETDSISLSGPSTRLP